ncbi:HDOD domain-containing protein [Halopseudomonas salegens]|uniref:HDOD domain-containing protein n=1 Tax=Halopseudomonas salegens TaxID=1434072 RepID=A0A1H2ELM0_9GAMM|nr:HDOD domain-containing protein [Halopseudomonas salegens]SDT96007.1 HDOD domain-containing protein [Halopseudomonas salegens]
MFKRLLALFTRNDSPASAMPRAGSSTQPPLSIDEDERIQEAFLGLVLGVHSPQDIALNHFEHKSLKRLRSLADSGLGDVQLVPRMPSVLPRLMSYFRDPETTSKELADLIGRDLVSVTEVMRLANSPYYRRSSAARSLEQAVVVLGQRGLRQLAANLLIKPLFTGHKGHFSNLAGPLLWTQSEKTAVLYAAMAHDAGSDEFVAYLAGLVANLGLLVGCRVLDQAFDGQQTPSSREFRQCWQSASRDLAVGVARVWELPDGVGDVLQGLQVETGLPDTCASQQLYAAERLSELHCLHQHGRRELPAPGEFTASSLLQTYYPLMLSEMRRFTG